MTIFPTIAAISTPRGKGGVAMLRISGTDALTVAEAMFTPASPRLEKLSDASPRAATYGTVVDSEGAVCDSVVATYYKAPASFTGEDTVEITCHGGIAVTSAVLLSAISHGATMAGAGEFTRRAFINGRLTLTEAEAVGMLIEADTREKMALSSSASRGRVTREIEEISAGLLSTMTALYAAIDYPEEDVGDEGEREILGTLERSLKRVEKLLGTYKVGKAVSAGVKTVIAGRPNVGKSSVFNLITGEESAIVTDIAGTTRDVLRETVSFGGITLNLADTAGLRQSDDRVEMIGVERAERELDSAELVIAVFDGSAPLTGEDRDLIGKLAQIKSAKISVINKSDRQIQLSEEEIKLIEKAADTTVTISAIEGETAVLSRAVAELFESDRVNLTTDAVIWDSRHREILEYAKYSLSAAYNGLKNGDPLDCICTLAEEALASLNECDGRGIEEKIISEIFSKFCVGK